MERFCKIDNAVENVFKWLSYVSAVLTFMIAVLVTINIITTKLLSWSIPSATDYVSYMFCALFYFAIGYVRLTQGLVAVDIFTQRFPPIVNDIITVFSDLVAIGLYGMIGCFALPLMQKNMKYHVSSSSATGSFELWPFNAIVMIFALLFALTMVWHIVRLFVYKQHGERPRQWGGKPDAIPEETEGM